MTADSKRLRAADMPELPAPGSDCICCANRGVLPAAEIAGEAVAGMPGLVDGSTVLKCCES